MSGQRRFHLRTFSAGLVAAAVGWVLASSAATAVVGLVVAVGGLATAGACVWLRVRPQAGSNAVIGRWDRRTRRHHGTASRWDIWRTSSGWAMRRRAGVVRPSL